MAPTMTATTAPTIAMETIPTAPFPDGSVTNLMTPMKCKILTIAPGTTAPNVTKVLVHGTLHTPLVATSPTIITNNH